MDTPGPSTEAVKPEQAQESPRKKSPKKSQKKQKPVTLNESLNQIPYGFGNMPLQQSNPTSSAVAKHPPSNTSNTSAISTVNLPTPRAITSSGSSFSLPMSPNGTPAALVYPKTPTNKYPGNNPTFHGPSPLGTSSNHSPITPVPINPFVFQNQRNRIPFNPNMAQKGAQSLAQSQNDRQDFYVPVPFPSSSQAPPVDSLRITVNNDHSRRTVQSQGMVFGRNTPHQFTFPAAVPFQWDQWRKGCRPDRRVRPRPAAPEVRPAAPEVRPAAPEVRPAAPEVRPEPQNNVATNYRQQRNWREQREDEDADFYKKAVIVMGFPAYVSADELLRPLSKLGTAQIEMLRNRVAVVAFSSQLEAIAALNANQDIPFYGTILTIIKYTNRRHVLDLMKQNRKNIVKHVHKGPVVVPPSEIDLKGDFYEQVRNIEQAIRLTQEEVDAINPLFEDIEKFMKMIYRSCEAIPFGSITTGQGIKSSDADCFVALKPGHAGRPGAGAAEHGGTFVNRAASIMRCYPQIFSHIVAIPKANTPIVKFLHVPTNMCCDLNSKTPLGVQNSRLIGHLLRADASGRFGAVALLLKYWAKAQDLSGTGKLTNYALTLMLIAYLQKSLLPSVVSLQTAEHSFIVENWEAGFDPAPLQLGAAVPPVRDILGGFFLHYAGFDFDELVVCPFMGHPMRKAEFDADVLPPEFDLYRQNIKNGLALKLRTSRGLTIQDPFELSHNVGNCVSPHLGAELKAHITYAAAEYNNGEKTPGDFLRAILLTRPPALDYRDTRVATRMALPRRLLDDVPGDWRRLLSDLLVQLIYRDVMMIPLTRRMAVSKEPDIELEVYVGCVSKPVWMRGANSNGRCPLPSDMIKRHTAITERIHRREDLPPVRVPFELELGFRMEPRGLTITTTAMDGAEPEAFRAFRHFTNTFIHRWCREFLRPHLRKVPIVCTTKDGDVINQEIRPDQLQEVQASKKKSKSRANNSNQKPPPLETVAFVNTKHIDVTESVATMTLDDKKDDTKDST